MALALCINLGNQRPDNDDALAVARRQSLQVAHDVWSRNAIRHAEADDRHLVAFKLEQAAPRRPLPQLDLRRWPRLFPTCGCDPDKQANAALCSAPTSPPSPTYAVATPTTKSKLLYASYPLLPARRQCRRNPNNQLKAALCFVITKPSSPAKAVSTKQPSKRSSVLCTHHSILTGRCSRDANNQLKAALRLVPTTPSSPAEKTRFPQVRYLAHVTPLRRPSTSCATQPSVGLLSGSMRQL